MDLFALTETQFIRDLMARQNENLPISYKDFVVKVYNLCNTSKGKGFAVSCLLVAEVEISAIQTETQREEVNQALSSFIGKALHFVRHTIAHCKEIDFQTSDADDMIQDVGLNWSAKKTSLIEIGYAFSIAKCFGPNMTAKEIIKRLARAFQVDITEQYIYKKYGEIRTRSAKRRTIFLDSLGNDLNEHMANQDAQD